jgi:hypothetical protein
LPYPFCARRAGFFRDDITYGLGMNRERTRGNMFSGKRSDSLRMGPPRMARRVVVPTAIGRAQPFDLVQRVPEKLLIGTANAGMSLLMNP